MNVAGLTAGRGFLDRNGINLLAVFDTHALAPELIAPLTAAGIDHAAFASLVLFGAGGRRFWDCLQDRLRVGDMHTDDPVDAFSAQLAQSFLAHYLGVTTWFQVYPGPIPVPLQKLGALAGWSHPSPLGVGIHPRFGTWFAYRGAYLIAGALPATPWGTSEAPCAACVGKPCVRACPVGAVRVGGRFELEACIRQRLLPASSCETRCLSRLACPVGVAHRYTEEQLAYHGRRSIESIRRYSIRHFSIRPDASGEDHPGSGLDDGAVG